MPFNINCHMWKVIFPVFENPPDLRLNITAAKTILFHFMILYAFLFFYISN